MSEANVTRPSMAAFKEALLTASAAGRFPAIILSGQDTEGGDMYACKYLTNDGKQCAIGIMLPKEVAEQADSFGQVRVNNWKVWEVVSPYLPEGTTATFALGLQNIHDNLAMSLRPGGARAGQSWPHDEFTEKVEAYFRDAIPASL